MKTKNNYQSLTGQMRLRIARLLLLYVALPLFCGVALAQSAADGYAPVVDGTIYVIRLQADGKALIGGSFNNVNGFPHKNLARVNRDGSLDTTFITEANFSVHAILVQSDTNIVIGGEFTQINGVPRNKIARVSSNGGALDANFTPNVNFGVFALAQQPQDGKILLGGNFTTIGNLSAQHVGRLMPDGSMDENFVATVNDNYVSSIAIEPDGQILLSGAFTFINGQTRNRLARLNYGGGLDQSFNPNVNNFVDTVALQPDGHILLAGSFTAVGGQTRNRLARLNPDGSLDGGFNPDVNNQILSLAVQADGKFVAAGSFTSVNGQSRPRVARFNFDGTLDSFIAILSDAAYDVVVEADGDVLIGGSFTTVNVIPHQRLARLHGFQGALDADFTGDTDGVVVALAAQADGKVLVGGSFNQLDGAARSAIGRMLPQGQVDSSFNPNANGAVYTIAALPDGKMLVGGFFTTIGGGAHAGLARLNNNGTLDNNFVGVVNSQVRAIVVQPDGKVVIGGSFTQVNGVARNNIARLNENGSLDNSFNPGANGVVGSLALQPDGQIIAAGTFTTLGGQSRNRIGRLNPNGNIDSTFNPNANGTIETMLLQGSGKILIGGSFTAVSGQTRNRIARLNGDGMLDGTFNPGANDTVYSITAHMNGIILVGGNFTTFGGQSHPRLARIEANGAVNQFWSAGGADNEVRALLSLTDGRLVVGGLFSTLAGEARNHLARLTSNETIFQRITTNVAGTDLNWTFIGMQASGSPEFNRAVFELSTDGINYTSLGEATQTGFGWHMTGLSLASNQLYFVRTRGFYASGTGGASGSVAERIETIYQIPCGVSVSPTSANLGFGGGTYHLSVTASSQSCFWTAQSNSVWLNLQGSGLGTAEVSFTVAANNGGARLGTMTVAGQTITIVQAGANCPVIALTPATLPNATQGVAYSQKLSAIGGTAPYTYQFLNGSTGGLALNQQTGELFGQPPTAGIYNFSIRVVDANGCQGAGNYTLTVNGSCAAITINPANLPNATANAYYTQTFTQVGGIAPVTITLVGTLPNGMSYNSATATLSGTPTQTGSFNFTVTATGSNGCQGVKSYNFTVNPGGGVSANNLQFYPLAHPVRLLDTRTGFAGCDAPGAKIAGGTSRTQTAAGRTCDGLAIPANAAALVGNATSVQSGGGYFTLYPSDIVKPNSANSNYAANQILNSLFTVRLGANDGAFKIFVSTDTDIVVDITGYYAPPSQTGLYYHPLPHPVRLLDTRAGATACYTPEAPLQGDTTMTQLGTTTCDNVLIPAGALALTGNATTVSPQANGFLTLFPADAARPLIASANFQPGVNLNSPFMVGLSPSGEFNLYVASTTDLVVDVTGYYSTQLNDSNGQGLLFNALAGPSRLLDTRAGQTACYMPNAQMTGGTSYMQASTGACSNVPAAAQAVVGNATTVNAAANGYLTFWPSDASQPFIATSNYRTGITFNRHFTVGLGNDGSFKRYAASTTDLVVDLVGYFAP